KPVVAITMGEPAGIGPEVVVKALADPAIRSLARYVVYGMNELLAYAADLAEIEPYWFRVQHDAERARYDLVHDVVVLDYDEFSLLGRSVARPTKPGGQASLQFLDDAITAALREEGEPARVDAIVTAPICKASWQLAGCRFPGHTELLQQRTHARRVAMMFTSPLLNVALATVHQSLNTVSDSLSIGRVFDAIDLGHEAMVRLGVKQPKLSVCGLNPHASEGGRFGDEEERVIKPAIELALAQGIDVSGPWPADTLFHPSAREKYDLVVAMYHDQGLIPVKTLGFDQAVNVTLGLPIVRTSPDHGTAFDIVGQNVADPSSLKAAIRQAVNLAGRTLKEKQS
ncbi:MAG: 4-hydroxythreonine-4-phosphate dehydrogenase PdxA, partial [Phycisphaeraceae bacterium]|nr:4-hydroxythreonine-4-phosphate dehydrogenase PdxA [Phycisphaeraceae bacterium]